MVHLYKSFCILVNQKICFVLHTKNNNKFFPLIIQNNKKYGLLFSLKATKGILRSALHTKHSNYVMLFRRVSFCFVSHFIFFSFCQYYSPFGLKRKMSYIFAGKVRYLFINLLCLKMKYLQTYP